MRLVWSEEVYGTTVPELDAQHQELFRGINALLDACEQGVTDDEVRQMLKFLGRYAEIHFATEERYMIERGSPGTEENIRAHRGFVKRMEQIQEKFEDEGLTEAVVKALTAHLVVWVDSHIRKGDSILRESPAT